MYSIIICHGQNIAAFQTGTHKPPEARSRRPRTERSIQTCTLFNDLCRMFEDEGVINHFFLFRLRSGHPLAFKSWMGCSLSGWLFRGCHFYHYQHCLILRQETVHIARMENLHPTCLWLVIYSTSKLLISSHGLSVFIFISFLKGEPVKKEHLFVAVKTCKKFHGERGASPPQKHFSMWRLLLKGFCSLVVLLNGWFSFVIPVCL